MNNKVKIVSDSSKGVITSIYVDDKLIENCFAADLRLRVGEAPRLTMKLHACDGHTSLQDVHIKMKRRRFSPKYGTKTDRLVRAVCGFLWDATHR